MSSSVLFQHLELFAQIKGWVESAVLSRAAFEDGPARLNVVGSLNLLGCCFVSALLWFAFQHNLESLFYVLFTYIFRNHFPKKSLQKWSNTYQLSYYYNDILVTLTSQGAWKYDILGQGNLYLTFSAAFALRLFNWRCSTKSRFDCREYPITYVLNLIYCIEAKIKFGSFDRCFDDSTT